MQVDPVQGILSRLQGIRPAGRGKWQARCPAHDDRHASLSVSTGTDGRVLLHCHADCSVMDVCRAAGIRIAELFPPKQQRRIVVTYDYRDAGGTLLFQSVRLEPKDFRQRRPDGNGGWTWGLGQTPRVLYRLPELLAADPAGWVFVVEGEKDADSLAALGVAATTNPMGAGKWHRLSDDSALHGRRVAILPDRDDPGRRHADAVARALHGRAGAVRIVELPGDGKDVSDWIGSLDCRTAEELRAGLLELAEAAPAYDPAGTPAAEPEEVTLTGTGEVPELPAHRFKLDLYGNADRFCHLCGRDVRWCDQRGCWYVWDGRIWSRDATREASRMGELTVRAMLKEAAEANDEDTLKWAVRCGKIAQARREMLDVVKHRTAVRAEEFDRNGWLLGVENGVLDLKTGRLLPHGREHMISAMCPTIYDPKARCARWDRFLMEIMDCDEAMIEALQRLAGYFLTGDVSVQVLPIFHGPGGNGKNVFLDTLTGLMGPYAAEAPEGLVTARVHDEHPTEIADLCGKRLVVASETEEGRKMRVGLVKKLTGNKYLKARFMRQDYFQFERTHKTVLVTNNKPIITETSNAIWRRLRLIPFNVTIPEDQQDRQLTGKLVAEWPGILAWAVRGCLAWQERRCDLALPEAVAEATEDYRSDSDPLGDFLQERCIVMDGVRTSRSSLYQAYVEWAKKAGEYVLSGKAFTSRMRGRGFDDSAWTTEHGKSHRVRAWSGVAPAGPAEEVPGAW